MAHRNGGTGSCSRMAYGAALCLLVAFPAFAKPTKKKPAPVPGTSFEVVSREATKRDPLLPSPEERLREQIRTAQFGWLATGVAACPTQPAPLSSFLDPARTKARTQPIAEMQEPAHAPVPPPAAPDANPEAPTQTEVRDAITLPANAEPFSLRATAERVGMNGILLLAASGALLLGVGVWLSTRGRNAAPTRPKHAPDHLALDPPAIAREHVVDAPIADPRIVQKMRARLEAARRVEAEARLPLARDPSEAALPTATVTLTPEAAPATADDVGPPSEPSDTEVHDLNARVQFMEGSLLRVLDSMERLAARMEEPRPMATEARVLSKPLVPTDTGPAESSDRCLEVEPNEVRGPAHEPDLALPRVRPEPFFAAATADRERRRRAAETGVAAVARRKELEPPLPRDPGPKDGPDEFAGLPASRRRALERLEEAMVQEADELERHLSERSNREHSAEEPPRRGPAPNALVSSDPALQRLPKQALAAATAATAAAGRPKRALQIVDSAARPLPLRKRSQGVPELRKTRELVLSLARQGWDETRITRETSLPPADVTLILKTAPELQNGGAESRAVGR